MRDINLLAKSSNDKQLHENKGQMGGGNREDGEFFQNVKKMKTLRKEQMEEDFRREV